MGQPKHWLGLDIGGANLKAAMTTGYARHAAYPLWKNPIGLAEAIMSLIADAPPHAGWAVTMTGELADCFATKAEGVAAIVAAVERAAEGKSTRYYSLNAGPSFVPAEHAAADWRGVAASNWHALATACAFALDTPEGVLIDVGSTTTDIVPFQNSYPCTGSKCDLDRLISGELLYQGVGRTPICAAVHELPYRGQLCPVAAELFATTQDAATLLDLPIPPGADTADGRPANKACAAGRMARMLCVDPGDFTEQDATEAAQHVCGQLEQRIADALERVTSSLNFMPQTFVLSGEGAWLARFALLRASVMDGVVSLSECIGDQASRCAPAWAVASLKDAWSRS